MSASNQVNHQVSPTPLTLENRANATTELQAQLSNAHTQIAAQQNNLNETQKNP